MLDQIRKGVRFGAETQDVRASGQAEAACRTPESRDFSALTISYKAPRYDIDIPWPDGSRPPFSGNPNDIAGDIRTSRDFSALTISYKAPEAGAAHAISMWIQRCEPRLSKKFPKSRERRSLRVHQSHPRAQKRLRTALCGCVRTRSSAPRRLLPRRRA